MRKFLWWMTRRAFKRLYGRTTAAQKFVTWLVTLLLAVMALIGPVLNPLLSPILSAQVRQDVERLVATVPSWLLVASYATIFVLFLFSEAYLELEERDQRITDLRTMLARYEAATLRLEVDPEDSSCRQEDNETMPHGSIRVRRILCRVRVDNVSGRTLNAVRVLLTRCDPQNASFYPVPLRLMNDAEPPFVRSRDGGRLNPQGKEYVDVVFKDFGDIASIQRNRGRAPREFAVGYADNRRPNLLRDGVYTLTLRVEGQDVIPVEARFRVEGEGRTLQLSNAD